MKKYHYNVTVIDRDHPASVWHFYGLCRSDVNQLWHDYAHEMNAIIFIDKEYEEDE